jgi:hypothetical protein
VTLEKVDIKKLSTAKDAENSQSSQRDSVKSFSTRSVFAVIKAVITKVRVPEVDLR